MLIASSVAARRSSSAEIQCRAGRPEDQDTKALRGDVGMRLRIDCDRFESLRLARRRQIDFTAWTVLKERIPSLLPGFRRPQSRILIQLG